MRISGWVCVLAAASAGAVACNDDGTANPLVREAGVDASDGATSTDSGKPADSATIDSALEAATEAGTLPPRLLVSYGTSTSQLFVVNVPGKKVDGTLAFPGAFGAPFVQSSAPFLLEQAVDVVAKLDPATPWTVDSTWNVALADAVDGGASYSDPDAILVSAPNSAYVLRYTRNEIAVLDVSTNPDGGLPKSTIDLSSLVQPGDSDGKVEMTAGVYVPATHLLYVVLGNIDTNLVVDNGAYLLCSTTVSSVIAIDTTTNMIAPLAGTAPGGGFALSGFGPIPGGVTYDAVGGRLIIDDQGCYQGMNGDGGVGPLVGRRIEAVSVATGQTTLLHDGTTDGFPSALVYIDATHAVAGYDFTGAEVYAWNPTQTALGALIPDAPDSFVYDGAGNLLGTRTAFVDGGSTTDIVSVAIGSGSSTVLVSNPFTGAGFVNGVDLWPHP